MQHKLKSILTAALVAGMVLATTAFTGCAGLQTQHQKIGAACETAASALEAVTAAKIAGKATQAQLQDAIRVYEPTQQFCQPVAESLSSVDYAALIRAAATLTVKKKEVSP